MTETANFEPAWFSPPGETVARKLKASGWPLDDFAFEMDLEPDRVQWLFDGRLEITNCMAKRLEKVLGVSANFWITREAQYRRDMVKVAEMIPAVDAKVWLRTLPLQDMENRGWIAKHSTPVDKVAECLRYFDVPSLELFERRVEGIVGAAKLRTSSNLRSDPVSLATWLRQGEIVAESSNCGDWNPAGFSESMKEFRKLTLIRNPDVFVPMLKRKCAEHGVVLVIAKCPKGCRASGATKFISKSKALLLLSFRHLSDDHFWFSFFHECGHLILHGQDQIFIEGEPHDTEKHEMEANEFAQKILIPEPWDKLLNKLPLTTKAIIRFAVRIGISPGIVVGQLQHRKRVHHGYLNHLKRRFKWV